jgi:hypothetical protein
MTKFKNIIQHKYYTVKLLTCYGYHKPITKLDTQELVINSQQLVSVAQWSDSCLEGLKFQLRITLYINFRSKFLLHQYMINTINKSDSN